MNQDEVILSDVNGFVYSTRGPLGHLLDTAIRCLRQKGGNNYSRKNGCRETTVSLNVGLK